jgi:mono/diheme cytochrome c family protein/glucose/arabinose dehydrogenase
VTALPAPAESSATTPVAPPKTSAATPRGSAATPVYSPEEERARFTLAPGYRIELVAAEPLVQDPVAIDFDADGRMYVVEMRGFMPNVKGTGEDQPVGRIVVLQDTDDDGKMDKKTIFLDSLVLPRAVKVLEHGVLVAATPNLWIARDTTGDLRADTKQLIRGDYGTPASNPEHNANGLLWGIDNWIHNANWVGEFRLAADGSLVFRKTENEGQWGVSSDEYGRLFRNSNEDPLRADLVPSHYSVRNANVPDVRGIYERLTPNVPVWPGHKTPAVNRGYRAETLRPDSTLAHYTSAGSPTAYVGDRLPAELKQSVFVTEPAGNLVGRFLIHDGGGGFPTATPAYDHAEFLTGNDQRFRPVNIGTAPDGTMYVVDMYRGIIQHRVYVTGYLEQKIIERGMEQPIGLGRIWRIVHTSTTRGEKPQLSHKSTTDLVQVLTHPNGWWRLTAQRLLVERGDHSVAPALKHLLATSADDRARLHALWTLDGLGEADLATVQTALADSSPHVRSAAVRIAEPFLAHDGNSSIQAAVLALGSDRSFEVRRQVAASLGELPLPAREPALLQVALRSGDDPVVADMVVTGLANRELPFLETLLAAKPTTDRARAVVQSLAAAILASHDAVKVQRVLVLAGQATRPRWQRLALLAGSHPPVAVRPAVAGPEKLDAAPPDVPQRRRGGGVLVTLPAAPSTLIAAMASSDTLLRAEARRVAEVLSWPGKTNAAPKARALTPAEQQRYAAGAQQYAGSCSGCHQARGTGLPGVAKPLVNSPWVLGLPVRLIRIVLHGKEGEMLMPPIGSSLTDEQLANVLTYVRRSWGNTASPIESREVSEVRAATAGRTRPWTEAELSRVRQ